jgi:hypothetical protein
MLIVFPILKTLYQNLKFNIYLEEIILNTKYQFISELIDRLVELTGEDFHGYKSEVWSAINSVMDKYSDTEKKPTDAVVKDNTVRKVEVYDNCKKQHLMYIGVFHQFGIDYEEFESGAGNFSTALIEKSDGTVENVYVQNIKFI